LPAVSEALAWIVDVFSSQHVPHQLFGGLAARAYGATRDILDIDFFVPRSDLRTILPHIGSWVVRAPARFVSDLWDVELCTIEFEGQDISLNGADDARIFDAKSRSWRSVRVDFRESCALEVEGVVVPVMPLGRLIHYKRILARHVDLQDIKQISAAAAQGRGLSDEGQGDSD
jgi:hypothetical protein